MERPIPTKTGVQIGLLYVNRTSLRPIDDIDMLRLQAALINTEADRFNRKNIKQFLLAGRIALVMLLAFIFAAKFALAKVML
jgi:hypothetical protein